MHGTQATERVTLERERELYKAFGASNRTHGVIWRGGSESWREGPFVFHHFGDATCSDVRHDHHSPLRSACPSVRA